MESYKNKKVSIIIPCYNKERFVGEAIESALSTSYGNKEVIVIDDGSTDKSPQVIREYENNIIWERQENRGAPAARNRGISISDGEFIKFLDADDILAKNVLSEQVEQTQRFCSDREMVFGNFSTIDGSGELIDHFAYETFEYGKRLNIEEVIQENIITSAPLYKKRLLEEVGCFDEKITKKQEFYLHIEMTMRGIKLMHKKCLAFYSRRRIKGRITSIDHLSRNPMYAYRDIKRVMNRVENPIPRPVRKSFGRDLWRKGRRLLRIGHEEEALIYFNEAKSISSNKPIVGSFAYRVVVRAAGPVIAEKFSIIKRPLSLVRSIRHGLKAIFRNSRA
ncbi:glycosyltransferase family 2 protein [Salinibacter ruber]|uniref:glycosyltransferase family 2 protein n=1 Tax=Salinibacter ruber TaxID=146919 RepID=UPI00216943D1|nr:glycosyltransferase family 2 protein [Salinibacter ruber]MCS4117580.1 glycosyltransferase involved in cell wall biosynthesis [Salinibacter ruber]